MSFRLSRKKSWNSEFELSKSPSSNKREDTSIFLGQALFPKLYSTRSWSSVRDGVEGRATSPLMSKTLHVKETLNVKKEPSSPTGFNKRITGLDGPFGITQMKNGNLTVAEWRGNSVSLLNRKGFRMMTFGRRQLTKESIIYNRLSGVALKNRDRHGDSIGELHEPTSVLVMEHNQRLVVVDSMNHRLQFFSFSGVSLGAIGDHDSSINFDCPYDICIDSLQRIYVTDSFNHQVKVFTDNCLLSHEFGGKGTALGTFKHPLGIAIDKEEMLYICDRDNSRVQKMNCFGKPLMEFKQEHLLNPVKVAVDTSGIVYVTYAFLPDVAMFDGSTGDYIGSFSSQSPNGTGEKLLRPRGILVDEDGKVFVCDTSRNEIWIF